MMTQTIQVRHSDPAWAGRPGSLAVTGRGSLISPGAAGRGAPVCYPQRPCQPWSKQLDKSDAEICSVPEAATSRFLSQTCQDGSRQLRQDDPKRYIPLDRAGPSTVCWLALLAVVPAASRVASPPASQYACCSPSCSPLWPDWSPGRCKAVTFLGQQSDGRFLPQLRSAPVCAMPDSIFLSTHCPFHFRVSAKQQADQQHI